MAVETADRASTAPTLAGLDALDLADIGERRPGSPRLGARPGPSSWRSPRRSPPGSSSSGPAGSPSTCCPARRTVARHSGRPGDAPSAFWHAIATTMRRGADRLRRSPSRSACSSASPWPGSASLRAAIGSLITGLQTMPVDRLVPAGDPAVPVSASGRSCSSSSSAPPRRSPTASSPASTTCRRCCSGPAASSARVGCRPVPPRHPARRRCPAIVARTQAGLGVRLAQPDGRRAAGHHREPAGARRTPRPVPPADRRGRRHRDDDRHPGDRHPGRRRVQRGQPEHPPPLGRG